MDKAYEAIAAIGGFAAIGAFIDFLMSRSKKDKLKAALEDWWLRFEDIRWGNFGRKEAELTVAVLDRWAGPRLWSWRRWLFSLSVTLFAATVSTLWEAMLAPGGLTQTSFGFMIVLLPGVLIGFALSMSVTRTVAVLVGKMCGGTPFDAVLFFLLLVFHWFLLA